MSLSKLWKYVCNQNYNLFCSSFHINYTGNWDTSMISKLHKQHDKEYNFQNVSREEDPFVPTCQDLAGFWDMVSIQVDQIHDRFQKLVDLRKAGWVVKVNSKTFTVKKKLDTLSPFYVWKVSLLKSMTLQCNQFVKWSYQQSIIVQQEINHEIIGKGFETLTLDWVRCYSFNFPG